MEDAPTRDPFDSFDEWHATLEKRHLSRLTFQEVRRAVRALSAEYVEKRRGGIGRALASSGKRAAFAMFYGPLHYLTVRAIVQGVDAANAPMRALVDLGCGTGVAGAAWAIAAGTRPVVHGIERHAWAADEARWTYRSMGIRGTVQRADLTQVPLPASGSGIVAAYALNELDSERREAMRRRLLEAAGQGASVLVIEPIARRLTPWWDDWSGDFRRVGARVDDWRVPAELPESLRLMDRAAGLDHRELTARSIWLAGRG